MIAPWNASRQKSQINRCIRQYFFEEGFLEVDTPCLCLAPIPENHIETFTTQHTLMDGSKVSMHLVPSPEVWMKLLLSQGYPSLYQISHSFRNSEPLDDWHRPEFTMLEWYEIDKTAIDNIQRMQDIFKLACIASDSKESDTDFDVMTMEEVFVEFAGFSLQDDLAQAGFPGTGDMKNLGRILSQRMDEHGLSTTDETETPEDLFNHLFVALIQDHLPTERPFVLTDWPALVPTLAKNKPDTPWAERWELFYRGVEVANCYSEETNLENISKYWDSQRQGTTDDRWPKIIADGMPQCSGVAVGLDRLLALLRGDNNLEGVDIFPFNDMLMTHGNH